VNLFLRRNGADREDIGLEAYGMVALTRILQMSHEEATKVFVDALRDVRNNNCHVYSLL
jgi:hypothetical protein